MKIGILTYHRSHNYGALLQAIALRHVLEGMGHEVTFIDYWPAYHRHLYKAFSFRYMMDRSSILERCYYVKNCILYRKVRRERILHFNGFIDDYILPYLSSMSESYDIIIHGSDQIWRKQPETYTYNPIYFGQSSIKAKRKISYAASMGMIAKSEKDKAVVKNLLVNLDSISVRELELKQLVESLGYNCFQHVDPTLLLTGEEWIDLMKIYQAKSERYVLYYHMLENSFKVEQIREFAHNKGMELKIIYSSAVKKSSKLEITTADPKRFLELILGAEYIFTSSFHGLVFSLLFQKEVFAAFGKNSGRAKSLLSQLGIEDRLLRPMGNIPLDAPAINYRIVSGALEKFKEASLKYLQNIY